MKSIDIRLKDTEVQLIKSLCGSTLKSIYHDKFMFTDTSSQIVKLVSDKSNYFLYSFAEPLDYFGSEEDVAVWSFEDAECPAVSHKQFIETPINEIVKHIYIVQERQKLFEAGNQTYDVRLTRGLIFDFGDYQVSFEKAVWFSEDIIIRKGYNLIDEFDPVENFTKDSRWTSGITASCNRGIITI